MITHHGVCSIYTVYNIYSIKKKITSKKSLNSKFHIHGFHFILLTEKKRLFIYNFCYIKHTVMYFAKNYKHFSD